MNFTENLDFREINLIISGILSGTLMVLSMILGVLFMFFGGSFRRLAVSSVASTILSVALAVLSVASNSFRRSGGSFRRSGCSFRRFRFFPCSDGSFRRLGCLFRRFDCSFRRPGIFSSTRPLFPSPQPLLLPKTKNPRHMIVPGARKTIITFFPVQIRRLSVMRWQLLYVQQ